MKIAYIRVSSREQNPDMQIQALQAAGYDKAYTEKRTGTKHLPELERCLTELRENDFIIVYKLDRLGRTLSGILETLNTIREKKANIISITENIDTTTITGRAMFNMIGLLAEYEHDSILERCADGRTAAKKRGVKFGRPSGSANIEAAKSCVILYQSGQSIASIQKSLNIKSRDTVYNYLKQGGIIPNRRKK